MNPSGTYRIFFLFLLLLVFINRKFATAQHKSSFSYSSFVFANKTDGLFLGHELDTKKKNHQFTLRYNYEAYRHLSGYYGHVLAKKTKKYEMNITPMVGVITNFNKVGGSLGFQSYFYSDTLNLYAYTQAYQITYFKKVFTPIFYNWTEAGYEFGNTKFFAGASYIFSREERKSYFSAGPFVYKEFSKNFSGSAYALVAGSDRYFLIGASWQF